MELIKSEKYKEAASLIIQLLEAPQLISMKFRLYVILQIANILPNVNFLSIVNILKVDLSFCFNFKCKLSEEQLFSVLRVIQNFENRQNIFQNKQEDSEKQSPHKVSLSALQAKSDKDTKLNEIFKNLSIQLSESFTKKSIEIN